MHGRLLNLIDFDNYKLQVHKKRSSVYHFRDSTDKIVPPVQASWFDSRIIFYIDLKLEVTVYGLIQQKYCSSSLAWP